MMDIRKPRAGKSKLIAMAAAEYGKTKRIVVYTTDPAKTRADIEREGGGAFPIHCKVRKP